MKYLLMLVLAAAVAGAVFSFYAVAQGQPGTGEAMVDANKDAAATDANKDAMAKSADKKDMSQCCPGCRMMMGKDGQKEWCKEMMEKAGISKEMMSTCRAMMNAPMQRDDVAMIMGWEKDLKLTDEQKAKLDDIAKEARQKALAVLTDEQRKIVDSMPAETMTMREMRMEMHKKMMVACKDMMKDGKGGCCPMMMRMHGAGGTMDHQHMGK